MTLSTLTPLVSSTCGFGAATHGPSFEELGNFLPLVFAKGFRSLARDPAQRSLSIFNLVKQPLLPLVIAGQLTGYHLCILAFKFLQTGVKSGEDLFGALHVGETGRRSL